MQKLLQIQKLSSLIEGDIFTDNISLTSYSTDASVYSERPLAVLRPKHAGDVKTIVSFANRHKISLIPRAAGTSLAGQVVGNGVVADVSKYMTHIVKLNTKERWVVVEAGVIRDELNQFLKPHKLFFAPETSTSNRCTLGGMTGNNACGAHSVAYGSTRDHLLELEAILSDGSEVVFKNLTKAEFQQKCELDNLEGKIYRNAHKLFSDKSNRTEIKKHFPKPTIKRRNHGYAIDLLLDNQVFTDSKKPFNFSQLIAGSEGTLAFITKLKLNLEPLPPPETALIAAHFSSLKAALEANLIALKYQPEAVELMDRTIMECTETNPNLQKNRFFIQGKPEAVLLIEFSRDTKAEIEEIAQKLENDMQKAGLGYHFPLIFAPEINLIWALRKAGLGLLASLESDRRSTTVIEDTAVDVNDLPSYIADFQLVLKKHGLSCVYYAHIGSGELHLRPLLNLKKKEDVKLFRTLAYEVASLVKKYGGSLSGEHGDGRLRGELIPFTLGEKNYELFKQIKNVWDENHIFNPNKIVNTPPISENLRAQEAVNQSIKTYFDFSKTGGIFKTTELCSGSGDCRKTEKTGGTMCPSFMATRDEQASTRARANLLRDFLHNKKSPKPFNHSDLYEVMDLCLSCKACKSECPSQVDMTKLKAEFLQHYYDDNGVPFRTWLFAHITLINRLVFPFRIIYNSLINNKLLSKFWKKPLGISTKRSMPELSKISVKRWIKKHLKNSKNFQQTVYLYNDEFSNFYDADLFIKAILLLERLGYRVVVPKLGESGRSFLSKGLVKKAQKMAAKNIQLLAGKLSTEMPLLGIEPSAILSFRDDYTYLFPKNKSRKNAFLAKTAQEIKQHSYLLDEFLASEIKKGKVDKKLFTTKKKHIKLHGHCYQKALASTDSSKTILSFPENYSVEEISSGCCGMAGSFGYESEHYELSMKVGELVLFPAIRKTENETLIAAPGTSCRQQILDGTERKALHPIEILYDALI